MREEQFISKNKGKWNTLENYNKKLTKSGISSLNKEEIKDFTSLYRGLSHQLAYARTHFPSSSTTVYLNQIIGQSYNYIFVREKSGVSGLKSYFTKGFRTQNYKHRNYFFASMGLFLLGALFCFILVMVNSQWGNYFFPGVSVSDLNLAPANNDYSWMFPLFSSFIMTNNIRVCCFAFALGVTAGIGTMYILFYNGMIMGALLGIIVKGGGSILGFAAMIFPHGFIELTAIFISGAAGLMIGKHILMPGIHPRKHAFVKGAKQAAYLIPGIAVMLVIAGLIEGYFTPLAINPYIKILFSLATLIILLFYFTWKIAPAPSDTD